MRLKASSGITTSPILRTSRGLFLFSVHLSYSSFPVCDNGLLPFFPMALQYTFIFCVFFLADLRIDLGFLTAPGELHKNWDSICMLEYGPDTGLDTVFW